MLQFDQYISQLTAKNKLAKANKFVFATCSGIGNLEGVFQQFADNTAFVVVDNISSGETRQIGAAWFKRSTYIVFFLHHHEYDNEDDRKKKYELCVELSRQFQTRFLLDNEKMTCEQGIELFVGSMPYTDINGYIAGGCTGTYIAVTVNTPIDLCYDGREWE